VRSLIFEDCKNLWLFQKCVHACFVVTAQRGQDPQAAVWQVITEHEKDETRLQKLKVEVGKLFEYGDLQSLESKARDSFSLKYNNFKNFLIDFSS